MKNYENAIKKLEQYGQDHIVKIMEKLTEDEKEKLAEQIEILDFDSNENLYKELTK